MTEPQERQTPHEAPLTAEQRPRIKTWTSAELLGDAQEARIQHGDEIYRLFRTRNDKLILQK